MTSQRMKLWKLASTGLLCSALACVVVAAQVSPPNAQREEHIQAQGTSARTAIEVPPKVLDRYVGEYQMNGAMTIIVRRDGNRLLTRLTGQPEFEIFPESETQFFWKVVDAQATFVTDEGGPASALIFHRFGVDTLAPRVEAGTAEQAQAALDAKIQSQIATPGSDKALRQQIESVRGGQPDYSSLSRLPKRLLWPT